MIKANELRIGNCIKLNNSHTTLVPRDFQRYCKSFGIFEVFEPITLTEEWLLKFGAIKYEFDHKASQYRIDNMLFVIRENTFFDYGTGVKLQYVHELQNLYFALTGEELVFSTEP